VSATCGDGLLELRVLVQNALNGARLGSCGRRGPRIRVQQQKRGNPCKAYRPFSGREQLLPKSSGTCSAELRRRLAGAGKISEADAGVRTELAGPVEDVRPQEYHAKLVYDLCLVV
jgi:hypothetical protein